MSDYLRIHNKLVEIIDRGHTVSIRRRDKDFEVSVFEGRGSQDHFHVEDRYLSEAMDLALRQTLQRWHTDEDANKCGAW